MTRKSNSIVDGKLWKVVLDLILEIRTQIPCHSKYFILVSIFLPRSLFLTRVPAYLPAYLPTCLPAYRNTHSPC
jgi:hypothetical protein